MSWADCKRIFKGIVVLFICIMLGVMVAEKQINNLTEYHDFVQACNIQGNLSQSYSLYFLGDQYVLPYTIAELAQLIKEGQIEDIVPAKARGAIVQAEELFTTFRQGLIKKADQTKKWLEEARQELFYEIENY